MYCYVGMVIIVFDAQTIESDVIYWSPQTLSVILLHWVHDFTESRIPLNLKIGVGLDCV